MNGGGDGPANDNVEAAEAANDNVDPNAAEGGGGGEGPNEAGDGETLADGDGAEAEDSNEAGERVIAWLHGLTFAIDLMVSAAGYEVQNRIDQVKGNLYEMSVEVSIPQPGDPPTARALSQEEQALMTQMEDLLKQAEELERVEKQSEMEDAAPEPTKPKPPSGPQAAELEPAELNRGSGRRGEQAANDNNSGGGDAPNE